MGNMSEIQGEMFAPFEPEPEEARRLAQEYFRYVETTEEAPWQTDRFEARPIDLKEKERLVKQKCARVAQRLRAQERNECR
jgi:hypothetical protein